jgi:predicted nuclease of predicted toxin-antitoxin system
VAIDGLSIRLYFDQHIRAQFAVDVRRAGIDVVTSQEVENERASDPEHLEWATAHGRTLFTQDLGDFVCISQQWFLDGHDHT